MALTDKELDFLEQQIPAMAELATKKAFWQTLASGDNAVIVEDGVIVEVQPDGTKTVVKRISKPQTVQCRQYTIPKR